MAKGTLRTKTIGQPWPLVASVLMFIAGALMVSAPIFGHMGPPWPCVVAGIVVIAGAAMMHQKPAQHTGWGIVVAVVSAAVMLLGRGGIVPGLIGVIGGVAAITWTPGSDRS